MQRIDTVIKRWKKVKKICSDLEGKTFLVDWVWSWEGAHNIWCIHQYKSTSESNTCLQFPPAQKRARTVTILVSNNWVFFENVQQPIKFLMYVADTIPGKRERMTGNMDWWVHTGTGKKTVKVHRRACKKNADKAYSQASRRNGDARKPYKVRR